MTFEEDPRSIWYVRCLLYDTLIVWEGKFRSGVPTVLFCLQFKSFLGRLTVDKYKLIASDSARVMTISIPKIFLYAACCVVLSDAFLISRLSRIASTITTKSKSTRNILFADTQEIEQEKIQVFNSDAIIPSERWDFADDIYLITTTEKGSSRFERTKEQLEKVNMMNKVKIRTFKPDDEDRVRGKSKPYYLFSNKYTSDGIYLWRRVWSDVMIIIFHLVSSLERSHILFIHIFTTFWKVVSSAFVDISYNVLAYSILSDCWLLFISLFIATKRSYGVILHYLISYYIISYYHITLYYIILYYIILHNNLYYIRQYCMV